jgi:hypothetical protein
MRVRRSISSFRLAVAVFISKPTVHGLDRTVLMDKGTYEFRPVSHIEIRPTPPRPFEPERFFPLMVDPSVLLSSEHLSILRKAGYTLFLSRELHNILEERDKKIILYVLRYFCWPQNKREIKVDFESMYRFIEEKDKVELYRASTRFKEEMESRLAKIHLPPEVRRILIDEYSFLRERSSLLLRYRKTVTYFKRAGMPIIDMANSLKDEKEEIFCLVA